MTDELTDDIQVDPNVDIEDQIEAKKTGSWWKVLLVALFFYLLGVGLLFTTSNSNLFPTVMMIGSFMVPVAYVSFFYERRHLSNLKMSTTALTFLYGGLLGVFAASILEPIFVVSLTFTSAFMVGLIEEFAKVLGVLVIARHRRHDSALDGLILGAAAGMGFAALESMGYAFTSFLRSDGSLSTAVIVTLIRGLLAPIGHGTWTALLVSVLFRESHGKAYHINLYVIGAYFTVVALHTLWNGLPGVLSAFVPPGIDVLITQLLVGGIGLTMLWYRWHEAVRRQEEEALPPSP